MRGGGGGVKKKKNKKNGRLCFFCVPFTHFDGKLNVKSLKKERKEGGNSALLISTSYTTREFRRLKAEIEPSAASALADSVSVGPHACL